MVRPAVLVALLLIILPVCILMVRRSLYAGGGSVTITGSVKTGTTAISGSAVTLYAAGDAYGSGASMLATAVSAGDGTFSLTFSCAGNQETYITATGGNAGQGSNSAIGLMAALGPCESLVSGTSSATINELTTAAAEWSLTQFLDSNGRILGAPPSNTLGLQNAYVGFSNLADINASFVVSGNPSSFLPSAGSCPGAPNCDGLQRLNTLANIIAGCTESNPSSTACPQLLCDATPGDIYSSSCSGTPVIIDTLGAAYQIVANPANNVSALFGLASVSTPFSPALGTAPDGWEMALNFADAGAAFNSPHAIALDGSGNVFVANQGSSSVSELTAASGYSVGFNFAPTGISLSTPSALALDSSGDAFTANFGNNSASELTASSGYSMGSSLAAARRHPDGDDDRDGDYDRDTDSDPHVDRYLFSPEYFRDGVGRCLFEQPECDAQPDSDCAVSRGLDTLIHRQRQRKRYERRYIGGGVGIAVLGGRRFDDFSQ